MAPTYLQFHLLFLAPPLFVLAVAARRPRSTRVDPARIRGYDARIVGTALMAAIAFVYTTPWDRYLVSVGVWSYGDGTVLLRAGGVPLGEYLFFLVQPVLTALWLYRLPMDAGPLRIGPVQRALGIGLGGVVSLSGWWIASTETGLYLGALLAWAGPVLALQWGFGWTYLVERWRTVLLGVGVPTLYLWVVDRIAIGSGIWSLSGRYTTGLAIPGLGLPVEETLFFLLTNLFVVQGLILWEWVVRRWA
ncbi:lycopene cyclase domain-containing protein [Salinirubellus sp. GCM10025818]|uniref:lycopene cyclase domain-containing protein n=1 Tax=Salinirubellus TaxID=2162630 RepID=UPI0030CD4734